MLLPHEGYDVPVGRSPKQTGLYNRAIDVERAIEFMDRSKAYVEGLSDLQRLSLEIYKEDSQAHYNRLLPFCLNELDGWTRGQEYDEDPDGSLIQTIMDAKLPPYSSANRNWRTVVKTFGMRLGRLLTAEGQKRMLAAYHAVLRAVLENGPQVVTPFWVYRGAGHKPVSGDFVSTTIDVFFAARWIGGLHTDEPGMPKCCLWRIRLSPGCRAVHIPGMSEAELLLSPGTRYKVGNNSRPEHISSLSKPGLGWTQYTHSVVARP